MSDQPTTLRGLARELGVTHSSLSAAVHEGRLTAGVVIEQGRVRVVDAAAAARQWRAVHVERIDHAVRRAEERAARAPLPGVVYDRDGLDWTPAQLLRDREVHEELLAVLVRDALAREAPDESPDEYLARLRERLGESDARRTFDAAVWLALEEDAPDEDGAA